MLTITALYGSLLAIVLLWLAFRVVAFRRSELVDLGDGGSAHGLRLIRAQQNATEYVPITVFLFAIYEINGGETWLLHAMGILMVLARIIHGIDLARTKGKSFGRFWGTSVTWLVILALALMNIYHFINTLT